MKTPQTKGTMIQKADRIAVFIEGVCMGLLLAYIISAFSHPLPDAVLYSACGVMIVAAWISVIARRGVVPEESRWFVAWCLTKQAWLRPTESGASKLCRVEGAFAKQRGYGLQVRPQLFSNDVVP